MSESPPKQVLIQPLWKPLGSAWDLTVQPPDGYEFVVREDRAQAAARRLARFSLPYRVLGLAHPFLPTSLWRARWGSLGRLPDGTDLVYAMQCLWFGRQPWVLEMQSEAPYALVGSRQLFVRHRERVRRLLRAGNCGGVIYGIEAGKQVLLQMLGGDDVIEAKTHVIPWAVPPRPEVRRLPDDRVRLLFASSVNVHDPSNFDLKGGKEVVEAFLRLRPRYPQLELIVRCPLSTSWRRRLAATPGVRIEEQPLSREAFDDLWRRTDIFVQPTHITPSTAYLEAMSCGVPVVATDVWGNPELVDDGRTGFLVPKPRARAYQDGWVMRYHSPEHRRDWHSLDEEVVDGLVDRLGRLIDDPALRARMGEAGRAEVERGRYSYARRNPALKQVLDRTLAGRTR